MTEFNDVQQKKHKAVGGWLLLLCIILTIISPLRTLYNLRTSYSSYRELSQYLNQYSGIESIFYIDAVLVLVLMVFSIKAGNALWTIKPGAVKTAKNYFFLFGCYTVISALLPFTVGLPSFFYDAMIPEVLKATIQSFIHIGIWLWYLNVSKRVKATYKSDTSDEPGAQ